MKPVSTLLSLAVLLASAGIPLQLQAQPTAFTYQGFLTVNGAPANGAHDLRFALWTVPSGGVFALGLVTVEDAGVTNGLFTVTLDFGASAFTGNDRWIEISARPGASTGSYTVLEPRQPVAPTPYAITALGAAAGSINSAALANGAVTAAKLASNSVTAASLGTNIVVGTDNIADGAITSNKLASASVGGPQLIKPYESGLITDLDYFFRIEAAQETNIVFASPFTNLPALSQGIETEDGGFAASVAPRILNRSSNGFSLQFTVTNTTATTVAVTDSASSLSGISGGLVAGQPAVIASSASTLVTFQVTNAVCVITTNRACCSETQVPRCVSPLFGGLCPAPYQPTDIVETNCGVQGFYVTNLNGAVHFSRAVDAIGNAFETFVVSTGNSPRQPALGSVNGLACVAYYEQTLTRLRFALASNSVGSVWRAPQTAANHADVGRFSSVAEVANAPAIAFYNATSNKLEYTRGPLFLGVPQWTSFTVVDTSAGRHNSMMVLNDRPVIATYRRVLATGNGSVVFYRATDATGSGWGAPIVVSGAGDLVDGVSSNGQSVVSLALVAGRPAIAFYDQEANVMKYVRASNTNGTAWGAPVSLPLVSGSSAIIPASPIQLPRGGACHLSVQGGLPTLQFAAGANVYITTARDSLGTSWNTPQLLESGLSTGAQVGGLTTVLNNRVASFHVTHNVTPDSTNMTLKYVTRRPPRFAINWIAVQP